MHKLNYLRVFGWLCVFTLSFNYLAATDKAFANGADILNLSDNRSSYSGGNLPLYEKFELTFNLNRTYSNNFDPALIKVEGVFTSPTGVVMTQPGFVFDDYLRSGVPDDEIVDLVANSHAWKVRFAPREIGTYTYRLEVSDSGGTTTSASSNFNAVASSGKGFVKRAGSQLLFDNGEPYFPIGTTSPWFQESGWGEGSFGAEQHYGSQKNNGGNWDRLWIDTGEWGGPTIRGKRRFWNYYSANNSLSLDLTPTNAHSGTQSAKIIIPANTGNNDNRLKIGKYQNWKVTAGQAYTFSFWAKTLGISGTNGGAFIYSPLQGISYPATPLGTNNTWTKYTWNFTASQTGRFNPELGLKGIAGTVWYDDVSLVKTAEPTVELGEDGGFEREKYDHALINLDEAWKLDKILEVARQNGVYVMISFTGGEEVQGSWQLYQNYTRYIIARWGFSTQVSAWEMCNENCFDQTWLNNWADLVASLDVHKHLRTTSFYGGIYHYPTYSNPKFDIGQLHSYLRDTPAGTDWSMQGATFDTGVTHSGARSVKITGKGNQDSGSIALDSGAKPGNYTLSFWVKGQSVLQTGNYTAPAGLVEFYAAPDNTPALAVLPAEANAPINSLNGTYDWKRMEYILTAPPGTVRLTLRARGGFIQNGGTIWFDELSLKDPQGQEVPLDHSFELTDYYDDYALALFREGRRVNNNNFDKPGFWGETGIEDKNNLYKISPYYALDTSRLIFHQWLWGATVSRLYPTGKWWYQKSDLNQLQSARGFINLMGGALPATIYSASSLDKNPEFAPSSSQIRAIGAKNASKAVVYIYHRDYTWGKVVKDGVTPSTITGATISITRLAPGTYDATWWNPQTGSAVSTQSVVVTGSTATLSLPYALNKDVALYLSGDGGVGCPSPFLVSSTGDDGTCGTLRYAVLNAPTNTEISFNLPAAAQQRVITLASSLILQPGVSLVGLPAGASCATGAKVTIQGTNNAVGLKLMGSNSLQGIVLGNFLEKPLQFLGNANKLRCTKITG